MVHGESAACAARIRLVGRATPGAWLGRNRAVARRNPSTRNLAHGTTVALVARSSLARSPLRRLLRRASGPRLCRRRGWAVSLLSPQPLHLLAGREPRSQPAV